MFLKIIFFLISDLKSQAQFSTGNTMSKSALVLVADGSEEMEFVITVDVLRRAQVRIIHYCDS